LKSRIAKINQNLFYFGFDGSLALLGGSIYNYFSVFFCIERSVTSFPNGENVPFLQSHPPRWFGHLAQQHNILWGDPD